MGMFTHYENEEQEDTSLFMNYTEEDEKIKYCMKSDKFQEEDSNAMFVHGAKMDKGREQNG